MEELIDLGYILKEGIKLCHILLDIGYKKKRYIRDDSKSFGWDPGRIGFPVLEMGKVMEGTGLGKKNMSLVWGILSLRLVSSK